EKVTQIACEIAPTPPARCEIPGFIDLLPGDSVRCASRLGSSLPRPQRRNWTGRGWWNGRGGRGGRGLPGGAPPAGLELVIKGSPVGVRQDAEVAVKGQPLRPERRP